MCVFQMMANQMNSNAEKVIAGYINFTTMSPDNFTLDNSTNLEYPFTLENILVPIIFSVLIVVGVLGNGLVIYVMLRHGERTTTNCYVVNLAITDMALIVFVIPFTMMFYVFPDWIFGNFMCKATMYTIYVSRLFLNLNYFFTICIFVN